MSKYNRSHLQRKEIEIETPRQVISSIENIQIKYPKYYKKMFACIQPHQFGNCSHGSIFCWRQPYVRGMIKKFIAGFVISEW